MDMEQKYKIENKVFLIFSIFFIIFIVYFLLYHTYNWKFQIPYSTCLFHDMLHLYCPGCGGTRAVEALLDLKLMHSFLCHPIVLYMAGVSLYYYLFAFYTFVIKRNGKIYYKISTILLWIGLWIVIIFFIVRNILLIFFKIDYLGDFINL